MMKYASTYERHIQTHTQRKCLLAGFWLGFLFLLFLLRFIRSVNIPSVLYILNMAAIAMLILLLGKITLNCFIVRSNCRLLQYTPHTAPANSVCK